MRRADDRRSASVMISSSIRWSLAGNDVDWMMKTSEPRTFSWISTKISMSAKRRTLALVSGRCSQLAISWASTGLELPATSLIEPFLADIDASPRALLDTMFSISRNPREPARFDERGDIRQGARLATHCRRFPGQKWAVTGLYRAALLGAVAERGDAGCILGGYGPFRTRHRGAARRPGREQASHPGFR